MVDPRLFRYSRSSRGFISLSVLNALTLTVLTIAQALIIARLIVEAFQAKTPLKDLHFLIALLVLVFTIRAIMIFFSEHIVRKVSATIRRDLRFQLFNKGLSHGAEINLRFGYGKLALLSTRGLNQLEPYFNRFIPQLFIAVIVPIVVGISIALHDLLSGIIIILTIPLIPLFGILIGRYTESAMMKKWRTMGVLSNYVIDLFNGLLTLKVFNRSHKQEDQIKIVGDRYRIETMKVLKISFITSLVLEIIATLSVALLAVAIGLRLVNGSLSLFTGLVVLLLAPEVYWPIRQVSTQFHASAEGVQASQEIFDVLEMPTVDSSTLSTEVNGISWTNLMVKYDDRVKQDIAAGSLKQGSLTVLSGPSGSGKTTLLNVLLGVLSPHTGHVSLYSSEGEVHLTQSLRDSWLQQVAWVSQDPQFPSGRIDETLRQINPHMKADDTLSLIRRLGLSESILTVELGDNNTGISLGQLRRLAILRAVLSNRQIVMLDEPTASLDDESERAVFDLLEDLAHGGKFVFVVTHSPELIARADHVISTGIGVK